VSRRGLQHTVRGRLYQRHPREPKSWQVSDASHESAEALQKVLDMGVIEGASTAINQIDDLVAS
jgi:hypothetical protein